MISLKVLKSSTLFRHLSLVELAKNMQLKQRKPTDMTKNMFDDILNSFEFREGRIRENQEFQVVLHSIVEFFPVTLDLVESVFPNLRKLY